jgi:tight adherence protein C
MTLELWLALGGLFVSIALITGLGASALLAGTSTERRRLRQMATAGGGVATLSFGASEAVRLTERISPRLERIAQTMPKSPKEMGRLRRRLAVAGIHSFGAAVLYSVAELTLPFLFAGPALLWLVGPVAWIVAVIAGLIGYMIPGLVLARLIHNQKRRIENGLPDALDLMIVCIEAGCGLDQAIQKTSVELEISHPALASELRLITTEVRAGKNRMEAFKNFAARTKVDDVRALVAMLVQTDRFGTSIAQALRTHAETSRTKRRQRAEEKAAKIGVKLVFPLVFFLFPAFYVVTLGPAVIQFVRVFFGQVVNR